MTSPKFNRRLVLGGLASAVSLSGVSGARAQGLGGLFGGGQTPVDPNIRFRAVTVDASPIADHGGRGVAAVLTEALQPQLQKVFADRIVGGRAPLLTARMRSVYLSEYFVRTVDAVGNNDTIEGDGIVSDGGRVVSSTHVLTELTPSYSGTPYTQGIDARRMTSIAYQFAYWLRREMGI